MSLSGAHDGIVQDAASLRQGGDHIHQLDAELEQRLAERTRQLADANEALDTFCFSVSHELRESLRTIQGYGNALRQDLQAGEYAKLPSFVDRIDAIAARTDRMLAGLLELARLSCAEAAPENLLLADVVQDAQAVLAGDPAWRAATIAVEIPAGLRVRAHRPILVQALANLLGNAVKFVRPDTHAAVRLSARMQDGRVRLEVQDEGIGMEAEALARIFNVFERLHGEEEYPGTGIGLAIVKKGVERMGGAVGVESRPGAGSAFWIELPHA